MSVMAEFEANVRRFAVGGLDVPELLPVVLTRAATETLGADGASLSVLTEGVRMPLGAANAASVVAEELQFSLGEGPCLEVYRTRTPVRFTADQIAVRWPVFGSHFRSRTPFGRSASFPLELGDGIVGALDLYLTGDLDVPDATMSDAEVLASDVARLLLSGPAADDERGPDWLHGDAVRRRAATWGATARMVEASQLSSLEALAVLRGYAFGHDRAVDDVAHDVATAVVEVREILDG